MARKQNRSLAEGLHRTARWYKEQGGDPMTRRQDPIVVIDVESTCGEGTPPAGAGPP